MENNSILRKPCTPPDYKSSNSIKFMNFIPVLLGVFFFFYIYGFRPLGVTNISWLGGGDGLQNYIGWEFFRYSGWNFPVIGLSKNYGLDVSSSIVFTDSNPLLSIFFKIFSGILPDTFQFFGVWLLTCCLLQSLFAWNIIKIYTSSNAICIAGTLIFMFTPAWINRVAHINLMAHFLLLAALYLTLKRNKNNLFEWPLLICLACSIHFYLAMMVMIIWFYNLISKLAFKETSLKPVAIEALLTFVMVALTLFTLGYFTVDDVSDRGGFGAYNNNLLSPIMTSGWSLFLSTNKLGSSPFESMNYWGLGVILLALTAFFLILPEVKRTKLNRKKAALSASCFTLIVIATTNNIELGKYSFFVPLPYKLLDSLSILRGSARFFWGVTYIAISASMIVVLKKCSHKTAMILFTSFALLQIVDISKGYSRENFYFHREHGSEQNLSNSFWKEGIKSYKAIRYVPFENRGRHWQTVSLIALENKIPTDAVYMARFSNFKADEMNESIIHDIVYGEYDDDTVYIIRDDIVNMAHLKKGDNVYRIDGLNVLAPHLKNCEKCQLIKPKNLNSYVIFPRFWGVSEPLGYWNGARFTTVLINSKTETNKVSLKYNVFTTSKNPTQRVIFKVDGELIKEKISSGIDEVNLEWANKATQKVSMLTIETPDAITPRSVGLNNDARIIGIGILSIKNSAQDHSHYSL